MRGGEVTEGEDGTRTMAMPYFESSPELMALIQTLYDHNWIADDFDWPAWQPVAERYAKEPGLLDEADLGTLRKLFTTHVRKERFCDGHLAEVTRSGHLLALLQRLAQIRNQLGG